MTPSSRHGTAYDFTYLNKNDNCLGIENAFT